MIAWFYLPLCFVSVEKGTDALISQLMAANSGNKKDAEELLKEMEAERLEMEERFTIKAGEADKLREQDVLSESLLHSVFDPKNGRGVFAFLWPNQGTYRRIIGTYWLALTQGFQWYQKDVCRCVSLVTMKCAPNKYYTGSFIVNWYTVRHCRRL